jgi:PIN domain nuclease of toxin-antitoxin system
VIDASAILAYIVGEPGAEHVQPHIGSALASAVNLAEAGTKLSDRGLNQPEVRRALSLLDLNVVSFDERMAYSSTAMRSATRYKGLSLGDRACLALAKGRGLPALTADRLWAKLDIGVEVLLIRE